MWIRRRKIKTVHLTISIKCNLCTKKQWRLATSVLSVNVAGECLHGVTIHSLCLVVSYQMTRARKIKSTLEWIISNSNENIMCS